MANSDDEYEFVTDSDEDEEESYVVKTIKPGEKDRVLAEIKRIMLQDPDGIALVQSSKPTKRLKEFLKSMEYMDFEDLSIILQRMRAKKSKLIDGHLVRQVMIITGNTIDKCTGKETDLSFRLSHDPILATDMGNTISWAMSWLGPLKFIVIIIGHGFAAYYGQEFEIPKEEISVKSGTVVTKFSSPRVGSLKPGEKLCAGTTKHGDSCTYKARKGMNYCGRHKSME